MNNDQHVFGACQGAGPGGLSPSQTVEDTLPWPGLT